MSILKTQFKTALSASSSNDIEAIGTLRFESPNKIYKWVRYVDETVTAAPGQACYYVIAGYENSEVTADVSDSYGSSGAKAVAAGVIQGWPLHTHYCWIQIQGPSYIFTDAALGAAGDRMVGVGSNDKGLDVNAAVTSFNAGTLTVITTGLQRYILNCPF